MRLTNLFSKTLQTAYSSPVEILSNISRKAKEISCIAIKNAYTSIPIDKKSQRAFSFFGPNKEILCFCHWPNSYKNAGFFLQQNILKVLKGFWAIFCADDIIVASEIRQEHNIQTVIKILEKLYEEGYKIGPHKKTRNDNGRHLRCTLLTRKIVDSNR